MGDYIDRDVVSSAIERMNLSSAEVIKCVPYTSLSTSTVHYPIGNVAVSSTGNNLLDRIIALENSMKTLPEYTELKCRECGATIEQKWDYHIVKCPYCKTVYVVGRKMTNG